ncbi:unnamed protein product [Albugo candida]|uniref:Uncharacterized protein n=1 Tax=Albugo candida TaxID=65357 RepID=A0A024GLA3_9STRA|nr:unnamed protein product [Albugo candida]|eukprot:CCI47539.1 unnamed protein product [Albugo candida]
MFIVSCVYGTFRNAVVYVLSAILSVTNSDKTLCEGSKPELSSLSNAISANGSVKLPALTERDTNDVEIVEAFGSNVELPLENAEKPSSGTNRAISATQRTVFLKNQVVPHEFAQENVIDDTSETLDSADEEMENAQEFSLDGHRNVTALEGEAGKQICAASEPIQLVDMTQAEGDQLHSKVTSSSSIQSMISDDKEGSYTPGESESEYTNDGDSMRDDITEDDPLGDMPDEEIRKSFAFIQTPGMTVYFDS